MKLRSLLPGVFLVLVFFSAALLSYIWTPFDVTLIDIKSRFQAPGATHWLGTDHYGRDMFSMLMVGARTSIAVAVVAVGSGVISERASMVVQTATILTFVISSYWIVLRYPTPIAVDDKLRRD